MENIENPQDVKTASTAPRKMTLAEAAEANLQTGILLLCKEALVTAIQDRRLERSHLRVLAALTSFISSRTGKAWPSRGLIADACGVSAKTVSNTLLELRNLGYLLAEREAVEDAGNRHLMVYTFGKIDHEIIRSEITAFVHRVRQARTAEELRDKDGKAITTTLGAFLNKVPARGDSPHPAGQSPSAGTPEVPVCGDCPRPEGQNSPRPEGLSPPMGTLRNPEVPARGERKSPPAGDSNSYKELVERKGGADAPTPKVNWTNVLNADSAHDTQEVFWVDDCRIEVSDEFRVELEKQFPNVDLTAGLAVVAGEALPTETGTKLKGRVRRRFGYMQNDEANRDRRAQSRTAAKVAGKPVEGRAARMLRHVEEKADKERR